ncbi:MAG: MFS transporter, partial [Pseudomonadota bacterium]
AGIRGLWIGPYLSDVYALDAGGIGQITLVMGLAMILGNFVYGPLDRVLPSRKWIVFTGNALGALACFALYWVPAGTL